MTKGQTVIVYDDGKESRPSDGIITHILSNDMIVVKFRPWGWSDKYKDTYLIFHRHNDGVCFEALNPHLKEWADTRTCLDSEYCIIKEL